MSHHRFSWIAPLMLLVACGSSGLNEEDSASAMAAMQLALSNANTQAEPVAANGSVAVTATCPSGGSVAVSGDWANADNFALDAVFNGCSASGVSISGSLSYAGSSTSTSTSLHMEGTLDFSGGVDGSCDVDVHITVSLQSVQMTGSMCGHDVAELSATF